MISSVLDRNPNIASVAKGGCIPLHFFCSRSFSEEEEGEGEGLVERILERLAGFGYLVHWPNADRFVKFYLCFLLLFFLFSFSHLFSSLIYLKRDTTPLCNVAPSNTQ